MNRRHSITSILLLLGFVAGISDRAQAQRRGIPTPKETIIPEKGVEVKMLRYNRLPMIETKINGKGPFRLILDTGASGIVLKQTLAEELRLPAPPGMPAGGQIQVRAPGSNGLSATLHYIDKLKVGTAQINGIWTIAMKLPFGEGMDGVIGMDIFHDCLLTFDYPGGKVFLKQGKLPEANLRNIFKITNPMMPNSHPQIELTIDGKANKFLIDTGMRGWFAMGKKEIEELEIVQGPMNGEMGMSAAGPIPTQVARVGNAIAAGPFKVENPIVRIMSDDFIHRVVGTFFLENFKVTFDAINRRVQLERHSKTSFDPPALRSLGFGLKLIGKQMVVWCVHPSSNAATQGIKEKDVVLEINRKPIQDLFGTKELLHLIQTEEMVKVRFQHKQGDSTKTENVQIMEILPSAK